MKMRKKTNKTILLIGTIMILLLITFPTYLKIQTLKPHVDIINEYNDKVTQNSSPILLKQTDLKISKSVLSLISSMNSTNLTNSFNSTNSSSFMTITGSPDIPNVYGLWYYGIFIIILIGVILVIMKKRNQNSYWENYSYKEKCEQDDKR
jgi:preprotein translocase subunit SecG